MKVIYYRLDYFNEVPQHVAACIGFFDGVHKGHQRLIEETKRVAKEEGLKSAMITFDPSPKSLVSKTDEELLTPIYEKVKVVEQYELDYLIIIVFNEQLQLLEYEDFIEHVLLKNKVQYLICGEDFRFGFKGEGTVEELKDIIPLSIIPEYKENDTVVSSTLIKKCIQNGDMETARNLLGRDYELSGYVVHGKKRGRLIGFPTANMKTVNNKVIPQTGVYTAITIIDDQSYISTINIGYNPTFSKLDFISIESFIHDFKDVVYGKETKFMILKKIRDEYTFNGVEELINQMNDDVKYSEDYFTKEKREAYGIRTI